MNGINVLIKETTYCSPASFHHVRTQLEGTGYEHGNGLSPECDYAVSMILNVLASKTVRNKFLLFINYPVCGILL